MKKTRRTRIVVETERLLVVGRGRGEGWCDACRATVRMVGLEAASVATGASQREIARRVEAGLLHFKETSGGVLLICLDSLLGVAGSGEGRSRT